MKKGKKEVKHRKKKTKAVKPYNFVLFLILAVLAVTLLLVVLIPQAVNKENMALYIKPVNCGSFCNEKEVGSIVKTAGKYMISYEAEFVKSPLLLVAKEGRLNLIAAQNPEAMQDDLCTLFGGRVCD